MRRILAVLVLVLAACAGSGGGGGSNGTTPSSGDASAGQEVYDTTCAVCHGADATGLPGLGKDLHSNEFIGGMSDSEVLEFLKVGRGSDDPLNDTEVPMPPNGGNPALSDEDLLDVIAFLRTLE